MQRTDIPAKIPVPFARDADSGHKRTIPASTPVEPGGATFQYGWQNINFLPTGSGGVPPFGQDFNGLGEIITKWLRWSQASAPIAYDGTFQSAIGGYPSGAMVESAATSGLYWVSTAENNTSNPDTGGSGWSVQFFPDPGIAGAIIRSTTSAGANLRFEGNGTVARNKTLRAVSGLFQVINNAYSASIFTLNDAGDISDIRHVTAAGSISGANVSANGNVAANNGSVSATFDGSFGRNIFGGGWIQAGTFVTALNGSVTANNGHLSSTYDGYIGRNLSVGNQSQVFGVSYFGGSGQFYANPTTGQPHIAFASSQYLIFDPSYGFTLNTTGGISLNAPATVSISHNLNVGLSISAAGNITASGTAQGTAVQSLNGNVTANNGRLRASLGARGSGDNNAGVLLGDFLTSFTDPGYIILPSGLIMQWISSTGVGDFGSNWPFPLSFPSYCAMCQASFRGASPSINEPVRVTGFDRFSVGLDIGAQISFNVTVFALGW